MRRTRAYTDTELGLARHAQTGEYFHGSPQQWRAYLDTLTGPEAVPRPTDLCYSYKLTDFGATHDYCDHVDSRAVLAED